MGKKLIIKGADFSANAIENDTEFVEVDLTQYTNLHTSIGTGNYTVTENLSTIDSYIIPVNKNEVYKLKTCTGNTTTVAAILTSDHIEQSNGKCTNIANTLVESNTNPFVYDGIFTIPTNGYLYIIGRNSTHQDYNPNYQLTLLKKP